MFLFTLKVVMSYKKEKNFSFKNSTNHIYVGEIQIRGPIKTMFRLIRLFLFSLFCFSLVKGQVKQTLCSLEDAQTFPSWCKHNNAFILPYLLTNLNQTLPSHLSEPVCDSNDQESNCYSKFYFLIFSNFKNSTIGKNNQK